MEDCIFCKIISGEIPCHKVYESENAMAFLDINPSSDGHTLIIPKNHYKSIDDVPEEELKGLFSAVKETYSILKKSLNVNSANIGWNDGKEAGQEVMHLHIHIMPRKMFDKGRPIQSLVDSAELKPEEVIRKIK